MRLLRRRMLLVMTVNFTKFLNFVKCNNIMKKCAFTLAEVLITLGIIGVVAALTLPPLVKNYKKQVIANQLKKAYNTIQNGIKMSEIDNGYMSEWPAGPSLVMADYYDTYWKPYFKGIRICSNMLACGYGSDVIRNPKKWSGLNWALVTGSTRLLFQLADGTVLFIPKSTTGAGGKITYVNSIYVDVNGPKPPNTYQLDVFLFGRNSVKGITPTDGALLIMQNGWKIPADYPYKY